MSQTLLTHFDLDPDRLAPLRECMENYNVGNSDAEWPNNLISRKTVVYENGVICRKDDHVMHNVHSDEFALCKRLAREAHALMEGVEVGMGSASSDFFFEFFIVANEGEPIPDKIDSELIRTKFGGTIFPLATITVEPLEEHGIWWAEVVGDTIDDTGDEGTTDLSPWRQLIKWFNEQPEFKDSVFVRIGEYDALIELDELPEGTRLVGCVLPRIAIGLTRKGSLSGIFGYSVQT